MVSPTNLLILLGVLAEPGLSRFDQSRGIGCVPGYYTILQYPEMRLYDYSGQNNDDDKIHEIEALLIE